MEAIQEDNATTATISPSESTFTPKQEAIMVLAAECITELEADLINPMMAEIDAMKRGTNEQWNQLCLIRSSLEGARIALKDLVYNEVQ